MKKIQLFLFHLFNTLLLLGVFTSASAKLEFESERQTFKSEIGATKQDAVFKFRNTGTETVSILEVKASCGCTTTALEKKEYAPGENGEIKATFNFGEREGRQMKTIHVTTSDPAQASIELQMTVDIPQMLTIDNRMVQWKVGDPLESKKVTITVVGEQPIHVKQLVNRDKVFQTELKEVDPGRRYEVVITPTATGERTFRSFSLITDFPKEHPKSYSLNARVY